jgi:pimeloyl-ACP methyl ester carboxylesterase
MRLPARAAVLPLLLSLGASPAPPAAAAALKTKPCSVRGVRGPARCGTLQVWENREARKGRRIGIHFVVLPASAPGPAKEAVAFLSGGPGEAATDAAPDLAIRLASVRKTRDLLFMDQRGTGGSNPLPCKSAKPASLQSYLTEFYTPADVARCAQALRARADVTQYGSGPAMDDLEELRAALGYDQLDLFGASYGTRAALVYLRRHPGHVRAILMHGSAPTDLRYPLTVPHDAQLALEGVFADCARDPGCHAAFPDPAADLQQSLRKLEAGPVRVPVLDPASGRMTAVLLARDRYTEALRALAYDAGSASLIPAVIHRAAAGDFGPAAEEELAWRRSVEADSRGVHLAVTCAEDVDFIEPPEAAAAAQGSFMGPWRAADQRAACAVWPHRKLDRSFLDPVRSELPLLVMNGEYDPATARYHAERLLHGFPNGRLVVIPGGGHGMGGLAGVKACYDAIVSQFLRTADAKTVDAACMAQVHRTPFPTAFPGGELVAIEPAALQRFTGRYAGPAPAEIRIERGKLHALLGGEDLLLLPTGPMRFRLAVSPHVRVQFREQDGSITAFELADGGAPVDRYVRAGRAREASRRRRGPGTAAPVR